MAFVYKWVHTPSLNWYVGYSNGKRKSYTCSSKIARPMIAANPEEWTRTIIATGTEDEMIDLETEILQLFDAKNDPRSYNGHNNDGICLKLVQSPEAREKRRQSLKGKPKSPEHILAASQARTGIKHSDETRQKLSLALKGRPWSEARREAQKTVVKGQGRVAKLKALKEK